MKKPLGPREIMAKAKEDILSISNPEIPLPAENLVCPYERCGKRFEKPLVLTDFSTTPRETYYACPYCLSRLEIDLNRQENLVSVSVKPSSTPDLVSPEKCPHYLGYLASLQKEDPLPEECLTCSKLLQCTLKK